MCVYLCLYTSFFFFFQAEDGIRDLTVTGVQTCALPISIAELGDKLAGLTIAQAVELKNYLKDKYGIEPAAGGVMMAPGGAGGGGAAPAAAAEPTEFNVVLEAGFDAAKKIQIIKVVRELTGQGLAEAK